MRSSDRINPARILLARILLPMCLLALAPPGSVAGADVSYYGVVKSIQYQQTNDAAPALLPTNAYMFSAFVVGATNHVVTNATVKPSNSTPLRTLALDTNGLSLHFEEQFNSQTSLDAVYPTTTNFNPVTYTTTMYTVNDGVQSGAVSFYLLIFPLSYPTTAQLTNVSAAQNLDPTRDFTLGWSSLGGSTLAIVQLTVLDAASNLVYASPAPFQPGALNGASTGAVIPAYILPPGANLQGHLTIGNPGNPNTNSYVGATGVAALAKDTQFPLTTRPAPAAPRLEVRPREAGQFQLRLSGETNRVYQILATEDLRSWTNVFTTNCLPGVFEFSDPESRSHPWRAYRGKIGQ